MTGPEHYEQAEQAITASHLRYQEWGESGYQESFDSAAWEMQRALVHATLAHAAAIGCGIEDYREWRAVAGTPREERAGA